MSTPADPQLKPSRNAFAGISYVWLVPILALIVMLAVAWQAYSSRGPTVEIEFTEATGIIAGETKLKYREVEVGLVEGLSFSPNLETVIVKVRLAPEVAGFVDADSQFWVVQPRFSARGVTGLQTVLSGVYIQGSWDSEIGAEARSFRGLEHQPASELGDDGLRLVLRSTDGSPLADGTPILFKGIEVGRLERPRLSDAGDAVLADAFIRAPYDRLVTTATRFWDASGFSFSLGAGGPRLDVESLAALVGGAVSFDTLVSGGRKPQPDTIYDLFDSEDAVRNSLFAEPKGKAVSFGISFSGTVSGLTVGAPVEFRGVRVGEVTNLSAEFVDDGTPMARVKLVAIVGINPGTLGLDPDATTPETTAFLKTAVEAGLRARLTTASILTGGLKVDLIELPDAPFATIGETDSPYPLLPSVAAEITDASATAEGVFRRVNDLPVEELMASAITLFNSVNKLANDPDIQKAPSELIGLLGDARSIMAPEELGSVPQDVREILASLNRTATTLETMIGELTDARVSANLLKAIDDASAAAESLRDATSGLPAIAAEIETLAASAGDLPLDELVKSTTALVATVDRLAGSEAMAEVPPALTAALDEIRTLTKTIREGGLIESATGTFAATQKAAEQISVASDALPALLDRLNRVATRAEQTLENYDETGRFSGDARETMREIREAAEAVASLARAIERNPNSIITGR